MTIFSDSICMLIPHACHFSLALKALDLLHSPKRQSSLFHTSVLLHTLSYNSCCSDHTNCKIFATQHQVIVSHFLTIANQVAASFPLHFRHYPVFHTLAKPSVAFSSETKLWGALLQSAPLSLSTRSSSTSHSLSDCGVFLTHAH